jgi:hypothetical protein
MRSHLEAHRSEPEKGVSRMSVMCAKAACKATTGMCVHEKTGAVVVGLIVVGLAAGKALSLF